MARIFFFSLFLLLYGNAAKAQMTAFDMASTQALIEHNKMQHRNKDIKRDKQVLFHAATYLLKEEEMKIKKMHDKLQKRLNSIFILLADVDLVIRVYQESELIFKFQRDALRLAYDKPWVYPLVIKYEADMAKRVKNMIIFFTLIANSYADISKMNPNDRRRIYSEVIMSLTIIRLQSQGMYKTIEGIDLWNAIKNSGAGQMYNNDVQKIQEILNNLKL